MPVYEVTLRNGAQELVTADAVRNEFGVLIFTSGINPSLLVAQGAWLSCERQDQQ